MYGRGHFIKTLVVPRFICGIQNISWIPRSTVCPRDPVRRDFRIFSSRKQFLSPAENTMYENTASIKPYNTRWDIFTLSHRNNGIYRGVNDLLIPPGFMLGPQYLCIPREPRVSVSEILLSLYSCRGKAEGIFSIVISSKIGVGPHVRAALRSAGIGIEDFAEIKNKAPSQLRFQAKYIQRFSPTQPFLHNPGAQNFLRAINQIAPFSDDFLKFLRELYRLADAASLKVDILKNLSIVDTYGDAESEKCRNLRINYPWPQYIRIYRYPQGIEKTFMRVPKQPEWYHLSDEVIPEYEETLAHLDNIFNTGSRWGNTLSACYRRFWDDMYPTTIPRLHLAILDNNLFQVKRILQERAEESYSRCPWGVLPIKLALSLGYYDIAEILLQSMQPIQSIYEDKLKYEKMWRNSLKLGRPGTDMHMQYMAPHERGHFWCNFSAARTAYILTPSALYYLSDINLKLQACHLVTEDHETIAALKHLFKFDQIYEYKGWQLSAEELKRIAQLTGHCATPLHYDPDAEKHATARNFFHELYVLNNIHSIPTRPRLHSLIVDGEVDSARGYIDALDSSERVQVVNQLDSLGFSPLVLTAANAHKNPEAYEQLLEFLLHCGASVKPQTTSSLSMFDSIEALEYRQAITYLPLSSATTPGTAKLLLQYGANKQELWPCIRRAMNAGDASFIEMAFLFGFKPQDHQFTDDTTGETLFSLALSRANKPNFLNTLRLLLKGIHDYLPEGFLGANISDTVRKLFFYHNQCLSKSKVISRFPQNAIVPAIRHCNLILDANNHPVIVTRMRIKHPEKTGDFLYVHSHIKLTADLSEDERIKIKTLFFSIYGMSDCTETPDAYFYRLFPKERSARMLIEFYMLEKEVISFSLFQFASVANISLSRINDIFIYGYAGTLRYYEGCGLAHYGSRLLCSLLLYDTAQSLSFLYTEIMYPGLTWSLLAKQSMTLDFYPKNLPLLKETVEAIVGFTGEKMIAHDKVTSKTQPVEMDTKSEAIQKFPIARAQHELYAGGDPKKHLSAPSLWPTDRDFARMLYESLQEKGVDILLLQELARLCGDFMRQLQYLELEENRSLSVSPSPCSSSYAYSRNNFFIFPILYVPHSTPSNVPAGLNRNCSL